MHKITPFFVVAALALTGCSVAQQSADILARDKAKQVVNGVVAERFPGVNAAPVTDCIIDNASAGEILTIAGAAITGPDAGTVELVSEIAQRPDTITCIAQNGLAIIALQGL